ncbi:MAG TPA: hypothetical protein VMV92_03060 [Streptosporangiaceae bacterium]|nr:hypothetical protein [Streptosporangiaceae bacterium]
MSNGIATSVYLQNDVNRERKALKVLTGYTDSQEMLLGLRHIRAETDAAMKRGEQGIDCPHPSLYPSKRCRHCFEAVYQGIPEALTPAQARLEQDETLREVIRQMGPGVTAWRVKNDLHLSYGRARRLLAEVQAAGAVAPVTFNAGTP